MPHLEVGSRGCLCKMDRSVSRTLWYFAELSLSSLAIHISSWELVFISLSDLYFHCLSSWVFASMEIILSL